MPDLAFFLKKFGNCDNHGVYNFIEEFWNHNQHQLYYGKTVVSQLCDKIATDDHIRLVKNWINSYYDYNVFRTKEYFFNNFVPANFDNNMYRSIVKMTWLFDGFRNNKKFADPICVHYCPTKKKFVVHPGFTRMILLGLINENIELDIWYHTVDKSIKPKGNFKPIKLADIDDNYYIYLVPEYQTFIPHIAKRVTTVNDKIKYYDYNFVRPNLSRLILDANKKDLNILSNFAYKNINKLKNLKGYWRVKVINPSDKSELLCLYSMLAGKPYEDKNIICEK